MTNNTTLSINIQSEDVGLFYKLLGEYHTNHDLFVSAAKDLLDDYTSVVKKEYSDSSESQKGKDEKSFYQHIIENCDCGTCLSTFARATRTPWRWLSKNNYINAEYGKLSISCAVGNTKINGYIYESAKTSAAKLSKLQTHTKGIKLKQELENIDDEKTVSKIKVSKAKIDLEKVKNEAAIKRSNNFEKVQLELLNLEAELSDCEKEHQYLYQLESAPEFNTAKVCKGHYSNVCKYYDEEYCYPCRKAMENPRLKGEDIKERAKRIKHNQYLNGVWTNPMEAKRTVLRSKVTHKRQQLSEITEKSPPASNGKR